MTPGKHGREPIQNLATVPHSGMCDAGKVQWVRERELGPASHRPVIALCTCGAGLLRLLGGAR